MSDTPTQAVSEGIWTRLRRRKLVQWGLAYAAGAWGFLQSLAYVSTPVDWPVQIQRLTGLALLIGLPVALVLDQAISKNDQPALQHWLIAPSKRLRGIL